MSAHPDPDDLGPVDVAVVAIRGEVTAGVAQALAGLHRDGVLRVLDLAVIRKAEDGTPEYLEADEAGLGDAFAWLGDEELDLLSDEDLAAIGEGVDAGSSGLVVVWENAWARDLASALRAEHGSLVMHERVPRETVVAALAALDD